MKLYESLRFDAYNFDADFLKHMNLGLKTGFCNWHMSEV